MLVFWDVDTQIDFIIPSGNLYIPGAEEILPNLQALTEFAHRQHIQIIGDVDYHNPVDKEISTQPDFEETFPPHCLVDSAGQAKVSETAPVNPLWVDSREYNRNDLEEKILAHKGEIFFRKQNVDVFSNPNIDVALEILHAVHIIVYGVAQDFCVKYAIEGLLARKRFQLFAVKDAMQPIDKKKRCSLFKEWKEKGVEIITTREATSKEFWELRGAI